MTAIRDLAWVGLGGGCGAALRFLIGGWIHRWLPGSLFPWGTFAVNVLGCLLLGLLYGLAEGRGLFGPGARLFLFIGLLGGFTTFSTFAWESGSLLRDGELVWAFGNVAGQVLLGLLAVWLGLFAGRAI
ncbi:MAG: fluoride efflux transporter CrcB [Thermoanaerobaculia bacterium]